MSVRRRDFLRLAGGAAAAGLTGAWAPPAAARGSRGACDDRIAEGEVAHTLATVSHERMLVKLSFVEPQTGRPSLRVNGRRVPGHPTDSERRFWVFDARGLRPDERHELELESRGCRLTEPWALSTFPAPDARPQHFRLLIYTCAGGHDIFPWYIPAPVRRRLLRRGLDFEPDAVVAVGDHVYWDLRSFPSALVTGASPTGIAFAGEFDRAAPVLGHANEQVLKRAVDAQIAGLYGNLLRSVPVFFVRDDHDYFEDDRATEELFTFPADPFMRELARASQWLFYPEFLPDPNRPPLPGADAPDRPRGVSQAFGTLRYGRLVEMLMYDCKGFVSLDGEDGLMVPQPVEAWLRARMAQSGATHVVNVPSNPVGWSAGKFAEWYPDIVVDGELTDAVPKFGWQSGWRAQHDRLLRAASERSGIPLFLSGDIHSIAEEIIVGSGALDLSDNPVVSLISGTPGTRSGWPSVARGVLATAPASIEAETVVPVEERNGFHIVDFDPGAVTIRHFHWDRINDPEEAIDTLEPFHVSTYPR
ncbi:MAG: hypothetical protein JSU66_16820 [Deltaproteobacteria bacterium]|nr:MAG: hypothetical protein JSU66_16820 [Deltaproteobacteria bacterium]